MAMNVHQICILPSDDLDSLFNYVKLSLPRLINGSALIVFWSDPIN